MKDLRERQTTTGRARERKAHLERTSIKQTFTPLSGCLKFTVRRHKFNECFHSKGPAGHTEAEVRNLTVFALGIGPPQGYLAHKKEPPP